MTLILSFVSKDYAIQVSDRRLTWLNGPNNGEIIDDNQNKQTLFCTRLAIGYTGLMNVAGKKTDEWLTEILATEKCQDLPSACNTIVRRATEEFNKMAWPANLKKHAFAAVGWTKPPNHDGLLPIAIEISNAREDNGHWKAVADPEFKLRKQILTDPTAFIWGPTGITLDTRTRKKINRGLKQVVNKGYSPRAITRYLAESIRAISDFAPSVGKKLLSVSIPKTWVENQKDRWFITFENPNEYAATFTYMNEDDLNGIVYGPNVVCHNYAATGLSAGPIIGH